MKFVEYFRENTKIWHVLFHKDGLVVMHVKYTITPTKGKYVKIDKDEGRPFDEVNAALIESGLKIYKSAFLD